jgi:hypothetical protein
VNMNENRKESFSKLSNEEKKGKNKNIKRIS